MKKTVIQRTWTITLCGNVQTGKTAFAKTLTDKPKDEFHISTLDEEYFYQLEMNDKKHKIKILDSPGHQEYRAMIEYDIKESEGILLFFDQSIGPSFNDLEEYIDCCHNAVMNFDLPIILVGNLREKTQKLISEEKINAFCQKYHCEYREVDCVKDKETIIDIVTQLYKKMNPSA